MKRIPLLLIASSLLVNISYGQIKKGSIFLGGDIGAQTQKTKGDASLENKQTGFYVSPVFGKAIKENLILGVDASLAITDYDNPNNGSPDRNIKSYGIGIFARKYKPIGKSGFYIFGQGRLGAGYTKDHQTSGGNVLNSTRYDVGIDVYPGISYAVSKRLQLETGFNDLLSINYFTEKTDLTNSSGYKRNGFSINTSLDNFSYPYIGFRVLIN